MFTSAPYWPRTSCRLGASAHYASCHIRLRASAQRLPVLALLRAIPALAVSAAPRPAGTVPDGVPRAGAFPARCSSYRRVPALLSISDAVGRGYPRRRRSSGPRRLPPTLSLEPRSDTTFWKTTRNRRDQVLAVCSAR